jgi:hypothetical protein
MGGVRRLFEDHETKESVAAGIAVQAQVMRMCPHETYIYDGSDPTPAYMLANALVSRDDPSVAIFGGNRRELTDYIKDAIEQHGDTCYACEKLFED